MTQHIHTMDVHQLKKHLDANPHLLLIDVREPSEWQEVHIPHARHIPLGNIAACAASISEDKTQPVYLHCRGGVRSLTAAQALLDAGYTDVYSIDGGIMAWIAATYPVIQNQA